jgi:hypothetical protein
MSPCALKEAYVSKMVKVCDSDRWSLISLGNCASNSSYVSTSAATGDGVGAGKVSRSCSVELKFVDTMRRQYEFSVDSFQVILDSLMLFYKCATVPMTPRFVNIRIDLPRRRRYQRRDLPHFRTNQKLNMTK